MVNLVVVRHHQDSGKYLFRVPHDTEIRPLRNVLCDTVRGEQVAKTLSSNFYVQDQDLVEICKDFGTTPNHLKYILGTVETIVYRFREEEETHE